MDKKLDPIMRDMSEHLAFLGYESEVHEGKQNPYVVLRHQRNPNFILDNFGGAIKFSSLYVLSKDAQSGPPELHSLLNELNRQAIVLKFYTETENLVLEFICPHGYSKTSFGAFWSMVDSDLRLLMDGRLGPFME
jgi:hypothetical protein